MELLNKCTLFAALLWLCPMMAAAQAPPQLDAQHMIFADTPLQFLGGVGRAVQTLQAMKPEEFEAARRNAGNGDVAAEALLCLGYRLGISVQQDQVQALSWCQRGADQGDPVALEELGMIYANGTPEQRDASKAIAWLTKAAALGSASAMDNIGTFYANGVGV
ncbi:MAG TPA: tetratricopeptide repeat protein, partial [Candidatus Dormibacteraeota bacterium]|nr:tetratricopeptide repeat protein [Candidatus Dormibacteraeota bacterium]